MDIDFINNYPEHVQELAIATGTLIEKLIPGIQVLPDAPAKVIGYGFGPGYKDSICTIILSKKEIKLGFYKGTELPDPEQLLGGTGKVHKYIAIRNMEDVKREAVTQILKDAWGAYKQRAGISA